MQEHSIMPAEIMILKDIVGDGNMVETHSSLVWITKDYVYKIKKPVYFGFLDYRLAKSRRGFCILEKELNSRYSKDVYLDVLKIVKDGKSFRLVPVESSLSAIEYVLKMRRIPDEDFLHNQISDGKISSEDMKSIGAKVGKLFLKASVATEIIEDKDPYELVAYNTIENFDQLLSFAPQLYDNRVKYIEKISKLFLEVHKDLFYKRYKDGYVKDGHGDLRLEHIYYKNVEVGLIDCIEFNKRFRSNDVMSESAFLSMELDYSGNIELSDAFLEGFLSIYPDKESLALLNFYRCYRAVVRAKVAYLSLMGKNESDPVYISKLAEFHRMIDLAFMYAFSMENVTPIVFCGMIATGKSVNAISFAKRFPVYKYNTDEFRKISAGIKPTDNAVTSVGAGIYTDEHSKNTYSGLGRIAANKAKIGRVALIEGTFVTKDLQDWFSDSVGNTIFYVRFTATDKEIRKRLAMRVEQKLATDGRLHHYEHMLKVADFPKTDYIIESNDQLEGCVDKLLQMMIDKHV